MVLLHLPKFKNDYILSQILLIQRHIRVARAFAKLILFHIHATSLTTSTIRNVHAEHIFSVMKNLWTDERNRLRRELVKADMCLKVSRLSQFLTVFKDSRW